MDVLKRNKSRKEIHIYWEIRCLICANSITTSRILWSKKVNLKGNLLEKTKYPNIIMSISKYKEKITIKLIKDYQLLIKKTRRSKTTPMAYCFAHGNPSTFCMGLIEYY